MKNEQLLYLSSKKEKFKYKEVFILLMMMDLKALNIKPEIAELIAENVCEFMSNSKLTYHNIMHVLMMFKFAQENKIELNIEQKIAIWFHDIIVNPLMQNNEELSSLLMEAYLKPYVSEEFIKNVKKHIIATSLYLSNENELNLVNNDENSHTIMDLDLNSLCQTYQYFVFNKKLIAKELKNMKINPSKESHNKFLIKLLERKFIFRSSFFQNKFESIAKDNLELHLRKNK